MPVSGATCGRIAPRSLDVHGSGAGAGARWTPARQTFHEGVVHAFTHDGRRPSHAGRPEPAKQPHASPPANASLSTRGYALSGAPTPALNLVGQAAEVAGLLRDIGALTVHLYPQHAVVAHLGEGPLIRIVSAARRLVDTYARQVASIDACSGGLQRNEGGSSSWKNLQFVRLSMRALGWDGARMFWRLNIRSSAEPGRSQHIHLPSHATHA